MTKRDSGTMLMDTFGESMESSLEAGGMNDFHINSSLMDDIMDGISLDGSAVVVGRGGNGDDDGIRMDRAKSISTTATPSTTQSSSNDSTITTTSTSAAAAMKASFVKLPLTGRPPIQLYLSCDPDTFSEYQVLVRKSIELFEAQEEDVDSNAQGRNHPIVLGQVGIRCRHCNFVPPSQRTRGSTYYPHKLSGLYQAAQNLAVSHLIEHCPHIPDDQRAALLRLREQKSAAGGGKAEWGNRASALGVYEDDNGLRYADRIDAFAAAKHHHSSSSY